MAHDVFISYASEDKAIADTLCAALEQAGATCWVAPRDVLPGMKYAEAILDAIEASKLFVLILSAEANNSPHVLREVERAVNRDITVVPVKVGTFRLSRSLEFLISAHQWLEGSAPPTESQIRVLRQTVRSLLGKREPGSQDTRIAIGAEPGAGAEKTVGVVGPERKPRFTANDSKAQPLPQAETLHRARNRVRRVLIAAAAAIGVIAGLVVGFVVISNGRSVRPVERLRMPDLGGLTLLRADSAAQALGLVFLVSDSVLSDEVERGCVADFQPPAGMSVKQGDTVRVVWAIGRRTCPECGASRIPEAKFCTKCGYAF